MKTKITFIIILIVGVLSCDDEGDSLIPNSIQDTKWTLKEITNKKTGESSIFPTDIKNVSLTFRKNGKIKLDNLCNYSFGEYEVQDNSIQFSALGPATEMYCETISEWEDGVIFAMNNAMKYQIKDDNLVLESKDSKVIFEYLDRYDSSKGKILFATNAHILNCLFEIDVFIGNTKIGTIKAGPQYNDEDCDCDQDNQKVGIVYPIKEGTYNYSAINTKCKAVNTVNSWTGEVTVRGDMCTTIFLNVHPQQ